jgi:multidrug efflux pump subunit AcrB
LRPQSNGVAWPASGMQPSHKTGKGRNRSHCGAHAIVAASQKRLRPILLTSATTVLGLAPMAVAGGALWQPMAVLMMSGLAMASLLTLVFVPVGYFLLFRFDRETSPA